MAMRYAIQCQQSSIHLKRTAHAPAPQIMTNSRYIDSTNRNLGIVIVQQFQQWKQNTLNTWQ